MGLDAENPLSNSRKTFSTSGAISTRSFLPGIRLSVIGAGALMLVGMDPRRAGILIAESIEAGVNYFDCAPSYGDGQAEEKLGHALRPYRDRVFLACKTLERSAAGAELELEQSRQRLRSGVIDLYQFHSVNRVGDMDRILAPGGAMETFLRAREDGRIRFIGFSSHSVPVALAFMDRFQFDSVLFPVNYVCFERGNFGPQVLERARARGVARVALKALAHRPWQAAEERNYPHCWYRPMEDPEMALQAMRFTLSEDVSALLPPADERLYRMALALAPRVTPLDPEERRGLLASARSTKPIMTAKKKNYT